MKKKTTFNLLNYYTYGNLQLREKKGNDADKVYAKLWSFKKREEHGRRRNYMYLTFDFL